MIDTSHNIRFMGNNLLDTGYNSFDISSVGDGFYESDLTNTERSRTFKFGGRFTIDATNNKIYFNGNTYTVTAAEYGSPATLATAITLAIAASGITCTWLSGKFIFTKGVTFAINTATVANSIWDTIGIISGADKVPTLVIATYTFTGDVPAFHYPNEKFKINFGYQASIGFVAIIGDLASELKVPEGATVTIKANNVDDFTNPPVNKQLTWSRRGLFAFIDDVDGEGWQYVELTIYNPYGPDHAEFGYLYIGDYSSFDNRNISTGIDLKEIDTSSKSQSDDGQVYSNEKTSYRQLKSVEVGLANPANVNFLRNIFKLKKKSVPFFVALDPQLKISETLDDMTFFCRFSEEPSAKHLLGSWFDLSFELEEAL